MSIGLSRFFTILIVRVIFFFSLDSIKYIFISIIKYYPKFWRKYEKEKPSYGFIRGVCKWNGYIFATILKICFFHYFILFARICFSLPLFYIAERSLIGWGNAIGNYSNRVSRLLKVRRTKPMQLHLNKHRCIDMQWTLTNKRNFFIRTRPHGFDVFRANNRPGHSKREHVFELHTWFINKTINKGNKDPSGRLCGGCDEAWEITLEKRKNFFSSVFLISLFHSFSSFLFFFRMVIYRVNWEKILWNGKKMVFDCIKYNKIPNNCKYIIVNFEVYVISFYTNKMIQHRIF